MTELQVGMILGGGAALLVVGTFAYRLARYEVARDTHRAAKAAVPVARAARWRAFGRLLSVALIAALVLGSLYLVGRSGR